MVLLNIFLMNLYNSQLVDLGLGGNELPSMYDLGTSAVLSILRDGIYLPPPPFHIPLSLPFLFSLSLSPCSYFYLVQHHNPASPPILHDWEINFHELEFFSVIGEGAFGQVKKEEER